MVLLLGIVKKNAIMMIDFALEAERAENLDPKEAIRRACLMRFRPILMTTMAALFGAVPLAIGFGAGSELRRPLGVSIVGGLCLSQLLNLFTTPVIYLTLDRLRVRRHARVVERRQRRLSGTGPSPQHDVEQAARKLSRLRPCGGTSYSSSTSELSTRS